MKTCPAFDNSEGKCVETAQLVQKNKSKMEDRKKVDLEKVFSIAYFKPTYNCEIEFNVLKRFLIQLAIANSKISITKLYYFILLYLVVFLFLINKCGCLNH